MFARASLEGFNLPPLVCLGVPQLDVDEAVRVRLEEQAMLTGKGVRKLQVKMRRVMQMDLYLQAASAGHAGLFGRAVGEQQWTLGTKTSLFAMMFFMNSSKRIFR